MKTCFFKKNISKRYMVKTWSFKGSVIVFALLNKIVTVNIRLIFIYVWGLSFKGFFLKFIKVF